MITRIKWKNHNVLGNLELDFTKEDGTPYNTIALAGENGVGNTILDTLADFLAGRGAITPFDYIKYVIEIKVTGYIIAILGTLLNSKKYFITFVNETKDSTLRRALFYFFTGFLQ